MRLRCWMKLSKVAWKRTMNCVLSSLFETFIFVLVCYNTIFSERMVSTVQQTGNVLLFFSISVIFSTFYSFHKCSLRFRERSSCIPWWSNWKSKIKRILQCCKRWRSVFSFFLSNSLRFVHSVDSHAIRSYRAAQLAATEESLKGTPALLP